MNAVQLTRSMPADSLNSPDAPLPAERSPRREVGCNHCGQPLFFPAVRTESVRTPFLFCRKCGGRTPIPTLRRRIFQIAAVVIFLAACTFVILTLIKEG